MPVVARGPVWVALVRRFSGRLVAVRRPARLAVAVVVRVVRPAGLMVVRLARALARVALA
ncbi:hypothetical protein [Streptomyces sp. CA-111067]|uniref:hypothetical protein n=1 Tax=Streptomyces sp. CA-111067 TaxID=3240046 RepID=UPI003D960FFF